MLFQIVPLILAVFLYLFVTPTTPTHAYAEYPLLYGMQIASSSCVNAVNLGVFSYQLGIPEYGTYMYWIIGAILLLLVVTYGWQKVGSVYVTRGLVRGDSVFIWSDFFYGIKKNFKQGFFLGLIDCIISAVLALDLLYFLDSPQTAFNNFMYVMIIALIILYVVFRFYTYLMVVTFDMKLSKVFKNALIFTVLGIKRNIMALLGVLAVH